MRIANKKSEETRKQLIQVAHDLFAKHGFEKVGIRDITSAAHVTGASFYYYFESKADIISEFFNELDDHFCKIIDNYPDTDHVSAQILDFFVSTMYERTIVDGLEFTKARMFKQSRYIPKQGRLYISMCKLIQKAQNNSELTNSVNAEEINGYLFLVFRGIIYQWCILDGLSNLKEELQKNIAYALRAFII